MNPFLDTLRNLGGTRLAMMGAVSIGLVIFFIFIMTRIWTPSFSLLYGDLDPSEASKIANELQTLGISNELSGGGTQILVPANRVGEARIAMAELGLPAGGNIGYEAFNKEEGLGTSNFVQNIRALTALQGELGRTIASISSVKSAKVLLVLPRRELFSRQQQEPSASVVLKMRGAKRLDRNQVAAVQHLVSAAVPNLKTTRISIIDDRGTLLARGGEEDLEGPSTGLSGDEMRLAIENRLGRKVEQLLEPVVGIGNVRVQISAKIDPQRVITNEERYDPDGQVLRSSQSITETSQTAESQSDNVSVNTNLPDTGAAGEGSTNASRSERIEEANNFEITKSISNTIKEAGEIEQLSVAVAINHKPAPAGEGDEGEESGNSVPRTPEEMQQYTGMVRAALGIDDARGDKVEIINLRFAGAPISEDEGGFGSALFGADPSQLQRLVEIVVLAVVGVLIILLVVRPVISRILEVTPQAMAQAAPTPPPGMEGMPPMLPSDGAPPPLPALGAPGAEGALIAAGGGGQIEESLIDIDQVEGRVRASSLRKVGEIIEKHPDEAVSIIRNWMYQEQ